MISLSSCRKDENGNQDARDQYVGTWRSTSLGSLTLFHNGQNIVIAPLNETGTVSISKSGNNALFINETTYIVNGKILSLNPQPLTDTSGGVNIVGTTVSSGTLGSNIITLNGAVTGTWNNSNGASGNLSGNVITTLIK